MRPATARNALIALLLLTEASHEWWLRADSIPQGWDQAAQLTAAERFRRMGPVTSVLRFAVDPGYYPPLVPWLASWSGRLFGNTDDGFTRIMPVFRVLLIVATYRLAGRLLSPAGALTSAVLLAMAPLVVRDARYLTLDIPLAAVTALGLLLLAGPALRTPRAAIRFGAVLGAGMLVKWTLPIFLIAPVVATTRGTRASRRSLGIAALVASAICGAWYMASFSHLKRELTHAAYRGADIAADRILSGFSLSFYPLSLPDSAGWPLTLAAAAGLVLALRDPRWRRRLWFVLVPLLLLVLIRNKKERYSAPVYPLLAILAGFAIDRLRRANARRLAVAVVLGIAAVQFVSLTFPVPWSAGRTCRPMAQVWPMEEIIRRAGEAGGGSLAVIPDLQTLNLHMAEFQALRHGGIVKPTGPSGFPGTCDWVIVTTGAQGPWHSTPEVRERITRELLSASGSGKLFRTHAKWNLPDGSTARLLRRRPAGLQRSALETALRAAWDARFVEPWTVHVRPTPGAATVNVWILGRPLTVWLDADGTPVPIRFDSLMAESAGATPYVQPDGSIALRHDRIDLLWASVSPEALTRFLRAARPHWKHGDLRLVSKGVRSLLRRVEEPTVTMSGSNLILTGTLAGADLIMEACIDGVRGRLTGRIISCRWAGIPIPSFLLRLLAPRPLLATDYAAADRLHIPPATGSRRWIGVAVRPGAP